MNTQRLFEKWSSMHDMKINWEKCTVLILTKQRYFERPKKIGQIPVCQQAKILGTWYDQCGKAHTAKKA